MSGQLRYPFPNHSIPLPPLLRPSPPSPSLTSPLCVVSVSKSSVINQLREVSVRRAGPRVAPTPGYTRRIHGFLVSTSPPLFLFDTPGVMIPSFGLHSAGQRLALNLALVRAFKDSLIQVDVLGRFLLLTLNKMREKGGVSGKGYRGVLQGMEVTEDVDEMVGWVAAKIEAVEGLEVEGVGGRSGRVGGVKERVVRYLLKKFRTGDMGPVMLDDLEGEMARIKGEETEREWIAKLKRERKGEVEIEKSGRRVRIVTLDPAEEVNVEREEGDRA